MSILDAGIYQSYARQSGITGQTTGNVFGSPVQIGGLYRNDGRMTVATVGALLNNSVNAGQISFTIAIPVPPGIIDFPIWVINGGAPVAGNFRLNGDGTATVSVGYSGNFVSGLPIGWPSFSVAYGHFLQTA